MQDRDLKNKQKTAENTLILRSNLTVQDRIFKIRSLAFSGKGIPAKGMGENTLKSGEAPANQTKERSVHELFAGGIPEQSSRCESCLFSKDKTPENSQKKRAKFMNFSFWPLFWFGLLGRLLMKVKQQFFFFRVLSGCLEKSGKGCF